MKKIITLLMAVLVSIVAFAGCSKSLPTVTINEVKDLEGLKIGVQEATTGDTFSTHGGVFEDKDGKYPEAIFTAKEVSRFKKVVDAAVDLKNGKVDCVIVDEMPAKKIIANNSDLKILDLSLTSESYAMAINKDNTELTKKIDAALAKLKENGTFDKIMAKYINNEDVELPEIPEYTSSGEIKMGTNAEFEPFEYRNDKGEVDGFDAQVAKYIAAELGMTLKIEDMAFDSLIMALQQGQIDFVAAGMTRNAEREKSVDFSTDYYNASQVIIVRK